MKLAASDALTDVGLISSLKGLQPNCYTSIKMFMSSMSNDTTDSIPTYYGDNGCNGYDCAYEYCLYLYISGDNARVG